MGKKENKEYALVLYDDGVLYTEDTAYAIESILHYNAIQVAQLLLLAHLKGSVELFRGNKDDVQSFGYQCYKAGLDVDILDK